MWRAATCAGSCSRRCLSSCGDSPTNPDPPVPAPTLTCPADIQASARQGQPPVVAFDTPVAAGGSAPVTTTCAPASGTAFPLGHDTRDLHGDRLAGPIRHVRLLRDCLSRAGVVVRALPGLRRQHHRGDDLARSHHARAQPHGIVSIQAAVPALGTLYRSVDCRPQPRQSRRGGVSGRHDAVPAGARRQSAPGRPGARRGERSFGRGIDWHVQRGHRADHDRTRGDDQVGQVTRRARHARHVSAPEPERVARWRSRGSATPERRNSEPRGRRTRRARRPVRRARRHAGRLHRRGRSPPDRCGLHEDREHLVRRDQAGIRGGCARTRRALCHGWCSIPRGRDVRARRARVRAARPDQ